MLTIVVLTLVAQLDSPSWRRREAATAHLSLLPKVLPGAERAYGKLAVGEKRPEVRERLRRLSNGDYDDRKLVEAVADLFRDKTVPWLATYVPNFNSYLNRARDKVPPEACGGPRWPEYRVATVLWVTDQCRLRRPAQELRDRLEDMRREEFWYVQDQKARNRERWRK